MRRAADARAALFALAALGAARVAFAQPPAGAAPAHVPGAVVVPGAVPGALPRVEALAIGEAPTRLKGDVRRVGGLSALAYRASDDRWLAVSDDKDEPRIYTIEVRVDAAAGTVAAAVESVVNLPIPPDDAESVALLEGGGLLVGYERPLTLREFAAPARGASGSPLTTVRLLALPPHILNDARINRGFESVAIVERPGGKREAWAATETALTIDGEEASPKAGTLCRVLVFDADSGAILREHVHRTLPTPPAIPLLPRYNSLTEWTPVRGGGLLALERSFSPRSGYDATLRLITPGRGETDVEDKPSAAFGEALVALHAETIAPITAAGATSAANFEGMALGPLLTDAKGGRLLLLVSDDNFGSDGQPTNRLLALRWFDGSDR